MPENVKISAKTRASTGTSSARRLRRAGSLPGVISVPGGEKSKAIEMNRHAFEVTLKKYGKENMLADIESLFRRQGA